MKTEFTIEIRLNRLTKGCMFAYGDGTFTKYDQVTASDLFGGIHTFGPYMYVHVTPATAKKVEAFEKRHGING